MTEETKAPEAAAEKAPKDEKNGVTRPRAGTSTGKVWEIADAISQETKSPADRKSVVAKCTEAGINPSTAATQYGKWRKYHGLVAERAPAAAATATPAEAPAAEAPAEA